MNGKKIILITIIVVIVVLAGGILTIKLVFKGWTDGITERNEEIRKSSLGDEFIFKYEDRDFPGSERVVNIFDSEGKERIAFYVLHDKTLNTEILTIIDLPNIRCYEIYGQLIYRANNEKFKGIDIDGISKLTPDEYPTFIGVAEELVAKKEWKWIKACGSFLLKAGNEDIRKMLERYNLGQFSQEELNLNKDSKVTKEQIRAFAKQALEQR